MLAPNPARAIEQEIDNEIDMKGTQQETRQQESSQETPPHPAPISNPVPTSSSLQLKSGDSLPRVGFGTYNTPPSAAFTGVSLAIGECGVRHVDTAQEYGNERSVGSAIASSNVARSKICVSSKLRNSDQSGDFSSVKRSVKGTLKRLGLSYVDVMYIHSPLTDADRRVASYYALRTLQEEGYVGSVGVANYGVRHLDEIVAAGMEPPDVWQGEVSFYNQRKSEVSWCSKRGVAICASSWSRLSGDFDWGGDTFKERVGYIASNHRATKAQVLVHWCLQKGYACVPKSSSEIENSAIAIRQNSYAGAFSPDWNNGDLTDEEIRVLDGMDVGIRSGRLGRLDGWSLEDVGKTAIDWDPAFAP